MKSMPTTTPVPTAIPARWARYYQHLQTLHEQILGNSRRNAEAALQPLESHSMDMADSATDEFDHNLALGLLSHQQDALQEIRCALRRIHEGRYGICEESGRPIAEERLEALPWTRYTREAAEKLEREGFSQRSRLGVVQPLRGFMVEPNQDEAEAEEELQPFEPTPARRKVEAVATERLAA
jgi:RNA polymerase-binding transcription factor DksA